MGLIADGLPTSALDYHLPEGRIATHPARPRSSARMLVADESQRLAHQVVADLPTLLAPDDLLVVNETAVMPARFLGTRGDTGGAVEGLFLEQEEGGHWRAMLRSNGKLRPGQVIDLGDAHLELLEQHQDSWACRCSVEDAHGLLDQLGMTPLPPYIRRARGDQQVEDAVDRLDYQAIYSDPAQAQSVAAPTAGLHFDEQLIAALDERGIERVALTLHVGHGTFKPIRADRLKDHKMHGETWSIAPAALASIAAAVKAKRRVIAVGTTVVRALESLPGPGVDAWDLAAGACGRTHLMISPPHDFQVVTAVLTNFHLPRSSLLALVAAFVGLERMHSLYEEAIAEGYRFYSYGDAMLLLPRGG